MSYGLGVSQDIFKGNYFQTYTFLTFLGQIGPTVWKALMSPCIHRLYEIFTILQLEDVLEDVKAKMFKLLAKVTLVGKIALRKHVSIEKSTCLMKLSIMNETWKVKVWLSFPL